MLYKPISGVLKPAKWPHGLLIAHAKYNDKNRSLSVTWLDSETATEIISRKIERYAASDKVTLLGNMHGECCGYRFAKHRYKLMLPVARKADSAIIGCKRKVTLSGWNSGADTLLQEVIFEDGFTELYKSYVSGTYAWERLICMMCDPEATPLGAPDKVYGASWPNGSRQEYWQWGEHDYSSFITELEATASERKER